MRKKETLGDYDINLLKEAREKIISVSDYNYMPSSAMSKKLETILNKLDHVINTYGPSGERR